MTTFNLSKPVAFGGLPAYVDPYFGSYVGDLQFSSDIVNGLPTELKFVAPAKVCSVVISLLDVDARLLLGRPASQIPEYDGIYAEFIDSNGVVLGTQRVADVPGLSTRGVTLQAYYSPNGQVDPYFNGPEYLRVWAPIASVKLYSPAGKRVIYSYDVGVQYQPPQEPESPLETPTPMPSQPPKTTPNGQTTTPPPTTPTPVVLQPLPVSFGIRTYIVKTKIEVKKVAVSILEHILLEAEAQIVNSYSTFIDDERYNKLLLNFGSDYQKIIVNQKKSDLDESILLVKLQVPLESFVNTGQPVFISREVAKTVIEKIKIELPPLLNPNPYLRPKIKNVKYN